MKKKLSIVIVSYNSKLYLDACLQSIYRSWENPSSLEVIISDNASTDDTYSFIRKKYSQVIIFRNKKNLGFARANNLAIQKANGQYILILNPDTLVLPHTLAFMVAYMDRKRNIAISTCRVELPDGTLDDACHRGFPTPLNAIFHFSGIGRLFPRSRFFNGYHLGYYSMDKPHPIDSCAGAFMLVREKVGRKLNWFDEEYFWYGEDLDFCFRAKQSGYSVYFIPQVSITHHKGISSGIKSHSKKYSTADKKTRLKATRARFAVMRIFYRKHYSHGINHFLAPLVFAAVDIFESLSLKKLNSS